MHELHPKFKHCQDCHVMGTRSIFNIQSNNALSRLTCHEHDLNSWEDSQWKQWSPSFSTPKFIHKLMLSVQINLHSLLSRVHSDLIQALQAFGIDLSKITGLMHLATPQADTAIDTACCTSTNKWYIPQTTLCCLRQHTTAHSHMKCAAINYLIP